MRKLKLYLETSAWNFYYADDAPEKRDITIEFFGLIEKGMYEIYISRTVIEEFEGCKNTEQEDRLLELVKRFSPLNIALTEEAESLAQKYLERKIVPEKNVEDALHVAIASVAEMDAVITWNYRHMANLRKSERFYAINLEEGYTKPIQVVTPVGVMTDES